MFALNFGEQIKAGYNTINWLALNYELRVEELKFRQGGKILGHNHEPVTNKGN